MANVTLADFQAAYTAFTRRDGGHITEASLLSSLNLDSLGMLEIVGTLEEQHGILVNEDDLVDLKSVADALRALSKAKPA